MFLKTIMSKGTKILCTGLAVNTLEPLALQPPTPPPMILSMGEMVSSGRTTHRDILEEDGRGPSKAFSLPLIPWPSIFPFNAFF